MPQKRINWLCIADAGTARIKETTAKNAPLRSVTTLTHEIYKHGRYEEPPKMQESATTARHAIADVESPIRREKRQFARTVAEFLNEAAKHGKYERLILAAPPKFLGDLRAALNEHARGRLAGEIDKDLTKESDANLRDQMSAFVSAV